MLVLIGCEESQAVTQEFRNLGHDAYSCDILPTRGDSSIHLKCDVMDAVMHESWDLIILHPECTAMAVSGNRWYGKRMPRHKERVLAVGWTIKLWERSISMCDKVVLENPVSVIFSHLNLCPQGCLQYIQPWMFGHGETKKTGLALHGVPELIPTDIVEGREQKIWKMPPSPTRKRDRSVTYQGLAKAMAEQWGNL